MSPSPLGLSASGESLDLNFDVSIEPFDVDRLSVFRSLRDHRDREEEVGRVAQPEGSTASELVVENDPLQSEARGHHVAEGHPERLLASEIIAFDPIFVEESLEDQKVPWVTSSERRAQAALSQLIDFVSLSIAFRGFGEARRFNPGPIAGPD